MIRHGEKPPKLSDGKDAEGLSTQGLDRAQYLPQVFGSGSQYNIGFILAEHPKKNGSRSRPYDTVKPLAEELGLQIDDSIDRDDAEGAAAKARGYRGPGNVLICWEHGQLAKIAKAIGVKGYADQEGKPEYPGNHFDLIWTIPEPYTEIVSVTSEDVPGLDS